MSGSRTNGRAQRSEAPPDVYAAAHELRTPLTVILGYAELLQLDDVWTNDVERRLMLARIIANIENELEIVDDWLDGGVFGNGYVRDIRPLPLRDEALSVVADIASTLSSNAVDVVIPSELHARVGKRVFHEVLSNLLSNAAKYAPAGAAVTVSATAVGEEVAVVVHNGGNGLGPDDLERIFDRGCRVSDDGDTPGSGLGLSIVRDLLTRAGGRIWAGSDEKLGTLFTFTLPRATAPATVDATGSPAQPLTVAG